MPMIPMTTGPIMRTDTPLNYQYKALDYLYHDLTRQNYEGVTQSRWEEMTDDERKDQLELLVDAINDVAVDVYLLLTVENEKWVLRPYEGDETWQDIGEGKVTTITVEDNVAPLVAPIQTDALLLTTDDVPLAYYRQGRCVWRTC